MHALPTRTHTCTHTHTHIHTHAYTHACELASRARAQVRHIVARLAGCKHNGFPVMGRNVDGERHIMGVVLRSQLLVLLSNPQCLQVRVCVCVCARVGAYVRVCVCACVRVCVSHARVCACVLGSGKSKEDGAAWWPLSRTVLSPAAAALCVRMGSPQASSQVSDTSSRVACAFR